MSPTQLQDASLFAGLDESAVQIIESHATIRTFFRNSVVLSEGDRTTFLYVILAGRVKVFCSDEEGKELVLDTLGPGGYFGELALIDDEPRCASVMTLEPTRLAVIGKEQLMACLAEEPRLAMNLLRDVVRKLRRETESVRNLALTDVYGRVVKLLAELATERDGLMVVEHLSYRNIAARIGASREMVGRVFKELKKGGYVTVDKGLIAINRKPPDRW
jgi:CRP/FNR family cyclic AMP-dependent transcriptional regulator